MNLTNEQQVMIAELLEAIPNATIHVRDGNLSYVYKHGYFKLDEIDEEE